ncbi:phage tail protein [Salipaludibacillus agaradhaerens]|jgi:phage-related protein|uniref:phage tail protein n=1 Tax=Salipaludibacillus agaradhaerens TaxID=76935 RepID=UPI0009977934|nr:hypothetical protein [Salipaludibacillus agaradhaerens]
MDEGKIKSFAEGLKKWTDSLSEASQKIGEFSKGNEDAFKVIGDYGQKIAGLGENLSGGLSSAIKTSTEFTDNLSRVGEIIGLTGGKFNTFLGILNPLVLAIVAIGAALVYAYNEFEWFSDIVDAAWAKVEESFTTAVQAIWDIINDIFGQIMTIISPVMELIKEDFTAAGEVIIENFGEAFMFIADLISDVITFISEVIMTGLALIQEFLIEHGDTITEILMGAYEFIKEGIEFVIGFIADIVEMVLDAISQFWDEHGQTIMAFAEGAWETIKTVVSEVISAVMGVVNYVLDQISQLWDEHGETIMAIVKGTFEFIKTVIGTVIGFVSSRISDWLEAAKIIFNTVWPAISSIVGVAWEAIKVAVKNAIDIVAGIIDTVMNLIKGDWEGAWEAIKKTVEKIWSNIGDFFDSVDLVQIGKDLIRGLWEGIGSMGEWIRGKISGFMDKITGGIKSFFGIKSPSKLFRDDIGQWLPKGLAVGIEGNVNAVDKALDVMTNLVPSTVDAPVMAPMEVARPNVNGGFIQGELAVTGGSATSNTESLLSQVVDELRKQKDRIIEMDSRIVGRLVEPYVSENQGRNTRIKQSFV